MTQSAFSPVSRPEPIAYAARHRRPSGQTLVEISVMVAVLMILAGALLPVVGDSIASARVVRAKSDAARIASGLAGLQRDLGQPLCDIAATGGLQGHVDLLVSSGDVPSVAASVPDSGIAAASLLGGRTAAGARGLAMWRTAPHVALLESELRRAGAHTDEQDAGHRSGWNGPYLPRTGVSDPWGRAFLVNVGLEHGAGAATSGATKYAVFVISAGPNGIIETPFAQAASSARAFGDDVIVRIQ